MSEGSRFRYLGVGLAIVIVVGIVFVRPPAPTSSTGVALVGCDYDSGGNAIGCSNSFNVPLGQSIVNIGGNPIATIGIAKAFVLLDYTGSPSSGIFTATERVDYAKGISDSYPISVNIPSSSSSTYSCSGTVSPCPPNILSLQKNFSLTLPVSSWSASLLQSKWSSSYGPQVVNVTVANSIIKLNYLTGVSPPAKPSAFNFVAQFKLKYLVPITTTMTSTISTSALTSASSTASSSTTTSTSTTTFATTSTSTSTTVSGGTISTGTVNVWPSATNQLTGGKTGTASANNVLVAVQPGSQSQVTVFLPANLVTQQCAAGCAIAISLMTSGTSVTESLPSSASNIGGPQDSAIGKWISWSFLASTSQGDTVVVQVNLGSAQIFNQALTVDGAITNVPYTTPGGTPTTLPIPAAVAPQYSTWLQAYASYQSTATAAANAASTDPCNHLGPVYNRQDCIASLQSVVSLTF